MNILRRRAHAEPDPLAVFNEELPGTPAVDAPVSRAGVQAAAVVALVVAVVPFAAQRYLRAAPTGTIVVESTPAGRALTVDGIASGTTPGSFTLPVGEHDVRIGTGDQQVVLKLTARPGETLRQNVVFEATSAPAPSSAPPVVPSEPAGASVIGDGVNRGVSPPARAADGKGAGWIAFTTPVPVGIFEGGDLLGTSDARRLMLPAGSHTLELRNDEFGYREKRVVQIAEAKTTTVTLPIPRAPVNINAVPWADVSIAGIRIGETPIGNHALAIGMHEVVFRHPEYGERRQTVAVKQGATSRVSVDFTKQR